MDGRLNADDLMFASVRARYLESPGTVAARLREAARRPGGLDGVTPAQALVTAGRLLTDADELDEAVTILRTAADLAPPAGDDHGARIALAIALALSGDSQPAEVLFRGGLSNKAGLGFGQRVQAALALAAAGQEAEAVRWADAALEHATKKRMGRQAEAVARKLQGAVRTHATGAAARRARPAGSAGPRGYDPDDGTGEDSGAGGSNTFERDERDGGAFERDDLDGNILGDGDPDSDTRGTGDPEGNAAGPDDPDSDTPGPDDLDSDTAGADNPADDTAGADNPADTPEPADFAGDTLQPGDSDGNAAEPDDPDGDTSERADFAGVPSTLPAPDAGAGPADDIADDLAADPAGGTVSAPIVLAAAADGTVLWWPQSEYLRLARQLPGLAASIGPGWAGHTARTEAGLRARARSAPGRIALIAADFGQFATYLRKGSVDPRDPDVLPGYAVVAAANGTPTAWPPWPLRACWCGSGRRYRNCCAVTGAAISVG
ncbi:MAG TPA: SEC-C metal-binding domain-containing protein [Streptosporangiaceae bacterium]|jgi:hypothetical protein